MVEVKWTSKAARDMKSIVEFIAKDSRSHARLLVIGAAQAADRIAEFPRSGRMVPELGDPAVREIILGSYRIVYRLNAKQAEVLTVHHGARLLNLDKLTQSK
jgi:toxin ParE1/3/4